MKEQILLISYFVGIMSLTILYAILSLLRIGSIQNIKSVDSILFVILCIWFLICFKDKVRLWCSEHINQGYRINNVTYIKLVVIMCFFMISIGRANISLDWDSAWYGTHSHFVLDNISGIFDNLKMVGCVFVYPKGYETYALPLNWDVSYTFLYAGNIIFGMWILYIAYKICRLFLDSEKSLWGALLISAIPGIMNMTIAAKPDIMTLFVQLFMIYFSLLFVKEKKTFYLELVLSGYIFSQTLKTTSAVFSTSILLALLLVSVIYKIKPCKKYHPFIIFFSIMDLSFIWYRTFLLTGIPATSIWGGFFTLIGMTDKYPYNSGQISQFRNENIFDKTIVNESILRIKEFLFAPNSADTDHIIIAWGTTLCTFMIIIMIIWSTWNIRQSLFKIRNKPEVCFSGLLVTGEFAGCLMSLWIGIKPDGNYFMLYYSVTIIFGIIYLQSFLVKEKLLSKSILMGILIGFIPLNMIFSGGTNWAWASSFNKINWFNFGYYNHQKEFKEEMCQRGCVDIYEVMSSDPTNRIYALAEHPFIEQVPCVIESETSVIAWGNVEIISSVENFTEFVKYSDYDYIYIAPEYVKKNSKEYRYLCQLFQENMVSSLMIENGHMLLKMGETQKKDARGELLKQFLIMFK